MISFDGTNFSEFRPEDVISFFWRSVYKKIICCAFLFNWMKAEINLLYE